MFAGTNRLEVTTCRTSGFPAADAPAPAPARHEHRGCALVHGVGVWAMVQMVWQRVAGRRNVLVSIGEPPRRLGPVQRALLTCVEGVVAAPDIVGALAQLGISPSRVATLGEPLDVTPFILCPRTRAGGDAHKLIYAGELSPRSGVADFLRSAIAWAERQPSAALDICWLGQGDLQGVLRAQVLPPNLNQTFAEIPDRAGLAAIFARCGILVVPSLSHVRAPYIAEAMTAGLPVLGSVRSAPVRGLVAQDETGWLFDPLAPGQIGSALDAALGTSPARLDEMRAAARARIRSLYTERLGEGVDQTLRALLRNAAPNVLARA